MKTSFARLHLSAAALTALALAASTVMGWALPIGPLNGTYTQTFDTGGSTTNFWGSGSVASWIYWYNIPGGNTQMTNDVSMDVGNNTNSGCLIYSVPWANASNTQDVIFGTFGNQFGYDTSVSGDMTIYDTINFFIRADPSTAPRQLNGTNVDYGTINVGFWYPYSFEVEGSVTIPLSASNNWVHLTVPINPGSPHLNPVYGIAFSFASFGTTGLGVPNYPALQNSLFYLDNVQVHECFECLRTPTLGEPYKPITGFNAIATTPGTGGEFNREQIVTANDTGYSFYNQANSSYSWNIKSFPSFNGNAWQAHFFILDGAPGPFDQAADYNLADVLWFTVSPANATNPAAGAIFNFRLKTNEPGGNSMLFNTISPTDTVNNPNAWPVEPIAALTDPNGALGTWTVDISSNTSITVTSPSGLSTNFSITPAQAAFFADPVSLILGGQPNNPSGAGQAVVYSSFTASGVPAAFTDNFLADQTFNLSLWKTTVANDLNGVVLVPTNALFWVPNTVPDGGFVLQTKSQFETAGGWTQPSPFVSRNGTTIIGESIGADNSLILSTMVADPNKAYFQLVQFHGSMLQVLFAGQTNAPGTVLGYTGSPTPISGATGLGADATVTINAVDSSFHIDTSITDIVSLTSNADPDATEPAPTALNNGTLTTDVLFTAANTNTGWTVTATDETNPNPPNTVNGITAGTSVPIIVNP